MHKIPTLAELHQDNPDAYANDKLKSLLNTPPNAAWIKKHPFTGVAYLPVDKVEYMLDRIFGRWRKEVRSLQQIENAVVAVVRLHYWNPSSNEWDWHDGAGAMPIQVEKDSKASNMADIKAAAIQLAAPASVSYALKDAADNLGKLFGRDITRKDTVAWDPSFKEDPFVNADNDGEQKPPPPPPPLPESLAAKVITKESYGPVETIETTGPLAGFTPPAFNANAFAAPVTTTQEPVTLTPTQIDLNIPLNF